MWPLLGRTLGKGSSQMANPFQGLHRSRDAYIDWPISWNLQASEGINEPSDSLVHSMLPDEPKTCTPILLPGHFSFKIRSNFWTNLVLLSSLSFVGSIRSYSSRMSPLSLSSSAGFKYFFGIELGRSNCSPPTEYGILLLECAIPVSNLQPATKGPRSWVFSDSERVERGEASPERFTGEGERE